MRRKRRPTILQRKRLFVGCEGLSEIGYIQWLRILSDANDGYIHIVTENLNGGSLVKMVENAQAVYERLHMVEPIMDKYLLVDIDRGHEDPDELAAANVLIEQHGFNTIWQSPNHEGFLLTHCEKITARLPTNKGDVDRLLLRHKPNYSKAMPKHKYHKMFDNETPKIASESNAELAKLLKEMKIIDI